MTVQAEGKSRRGRDSRKEERLTHETKMLPALKRNLPLTEPMDEEQILRIDNASMEILENIGVHFRDPIALTDWKKIGAKVVDQTVFADRSLIKELIKTIPESFTLQRNGGVKTILFNDKNKFALIKSFPLSP